MEQKAFPLQNRGMNRDASISKANNSSAYENRNIRVTARDKDTLLSVTNERGTKQIDLGDTIKGTVIGWNVLNKHIILFSTTSPAGKYRGDGYEYGNTFYSIRGKWRYYSLQFSGTGGTSEEFIAGVPSTRWMTQAEAAEALNAQVQAAGIDISVDTVTFVEEGEDVTYIRIYVSKETYENQYQSATMIAKVLVTAPDNPVTVQFRKWIITDDPDQSSNPDYIYRIDYDGEDFQMKYGNTDSGKEDGVVGEPIFNGKLRFDVMSPIESIVYYETEEIQKIYWVDGYNVLRFMNFMEPADNVENDWDDTYFDSNRIAQLGLDVTIKKTNTGNTRANGVVQYLVTYFNKHGLQTGYVWVSDLVYLSPMDYGGSPDGFNNNSIELSISGLDTSYEYFRVYSIERSSINGTTTGYLVAEKAVESSGISIVIDTGKPISTVDASSLLFLGSRSVVAGTMTHKDETLFLGDLSSVGRGDYRVIQDAIGDLVFVDETTGEPKRRKDGAYMSGIVSFQLSDGTDDKEDIPYVDCTGSYPYETQLKYTSSEIKTFKGGEKYRFALRFHSPNGVSSDAFWIGDKINTLYPRIDGNVIHRVVAVCTVPPGVLNVASNAGFTSVELMIAEADYSDRLVLAQGIVNPTVFNVWERFRKQTFSYSSWIFRPKHSGFSWQHFSPIVNSTNPYGEIQCNYWSSDIDTPTPYYRTYTASDPTEEISAGDIVGGLDGVPDYDAFALAFMVGRTNTFKYEGGVSIIKITYDYPLTDTIFRSESGLTISDILALADPDWQTHTMSLAGVSAFDGDYTATGSFVYNSVTYTFDIVLTRKYFPPKGKKESSKESLFSRMYEYLTAEANIEQTLIPSSTEIGDWIGIMRGNDHYHRFDDRTWFLKLGTVPTDGFANESLAFGGTSWTTENISENNPDKKYYTAYHKKHLMFVDENIVTLNSPEFDAEAVNVDNLQCGFRIVGVAKITGNTSDYTLLAGPAHLAGTNLYNMSFSSDNTENYSEYDGPDGLVSWPLYLENDLIDNPDAPDMPEDVDFRTNSYFRWGPGIVQYWLHMWQKNGTIQDFVDEDGVVYSELTKKWFANLRFAHSTYYNNLDENQVVFIPYAGDTGGSIRQFNYTNEQLVNIKYYGDSVNYSGNPSISLSVPGSHKYPILYSGVGVSDKGITPMAEYKKTSSSPVVMRFLSSPHAVISLGTFSAGRVNILPYLFNTHGGDHYIDPIPTDVSPTATDAILPWSVSGVTDLVARSVSLPFTPSSSWSSKVTEGDRYLFIGELYKEADPDKDYGGHDDSVIEATRFISAGPQYSIENASEAVEITGNQGDTYFQRWDCLKTKPNSEDAVNGVIDIASVMVETHINIDGRYDKQRGTSLLASINTEQFNSINPVYSQSNNFFTSFDQDSDADLDTYRASLTWTLTKADAADIDEWTHITLANNMKLDGDKGICRALRRFNNSIFAFQDRGIAEILFNSRTQIPTTEGVPIEIANSGKVDGKRYISNKYGCLNKWSIVEGKAGLYFIDNINKMFGRVDQGITDLSSKLSFNAWFRRKNDTEPWNPKDFNNYVAFYDRIHSDVYLVKNDDDSEGPCLVYNEQLDAFTGFFDYGGVPMMTNVEDRFISFKNHYLWRQNEGLYCNFFGDQYDFWVTYRVTPDPYGDKIWTNLEYRADFHNILVGVPEPGDYSGEAIIRMGYDEANVVKDMTFDSLKVWNEYQTTQDLKVADIAKDQYADTRKKFRIWRMDIPRAIATATNKYGLDRIRNPWVFIRLRKDMTKTNANKCLMQLHDVVVKYFE